MRQTWTRAVYAAAFSLWSVSVFVGVRSAQASDILVIHRPAVHKMTPYYKSGDLIPLNGPVIRVFSKTGKQYDAIANDNQNLKYAVEVGAACGSGKKLTMASVAVDGTSKSIYEGRKRSLDNRTVVLDIPFTIPDMPRSPVAACNHELDRRVAQFGTSRESLMQRGFVVTYDNAFTSKFTVACSRPLGKGHLEVSELKTKVWIACEPVGLKGKPAGTGGGAGKPNTPNSKPAPRPRKPKVKARIEAHPAVLHAKSCPATIRFSGKIFAMGATSVTYRIEGSGWRSPVRRMTFKKAGSQDIVGWTKRFAAPKRDLNKLAAPGGKKTPDYQGWAAIRILEPRDQAGLSKKVTYKVFCNAAPPVRVLKKVVPARRPRGE